jgi:hypothetical protein
MSIRHSVAERDGLTRLGGKMDRLVGKPWSAARLSYGGEVRAEFGTLTARPRGSQKGEWTLGTRGSPWQLAVAGKPVASERDDEQSWVGALEVLKGQVVSRVVVTVPGPDLLIEFESGAAFSILASKLPEWQAWELFCPDGSTIVANADGTWVEGRRDEVGEGG